MKGLRKSEDDLDADSSTAIYAVCQNCGIKVKSDKLKCPNCGKDFN